jgi:hypothetical protein
MKLKKELKLTMTKEQEQALKQAVDILTDMELDMEHEDIDQIQEQYEKDLDYVSHTTALPTAIDYIGTLLCMAEIVEETDEEEDD